MVKVIGMGGLELCFLQSREGVGAEINQSEMTAHPQARMPVPHYHEIRDEMVCGLSGRTTCTMDGADEPLSLRERPFIRRFITSPVEPRPQPGGTWRPYGSALGTEPPAT